MSQMWLVIENIVIYAAIAACVVGGAWLTGEWWGLWSLVLLGCVNNTMIRP